MNSIFSIEETFTGGFPVKSNEATANTLDGKAFRVGYQTAKLENDRSKLMQDQMLFEQQKAAVIQQLLSAQAQLASSVASQLGTQAGLAQGIGIGAGAAQAAMTPMPPGMGGGMPPMGPEMGGAPPPPDMGGMPTGMPPMM
jgi:hypothetical protein